ncbi:hypothetical protein Patl1_22248 [Pistacia atlantica]|uniref:Uncharacterized protein n=1 Tax=Pistacia atlantica TaxID=434234 RepID=A0ACC1BKI7_9ROSI|nr:hypothetical protein Patl1_22248 [Pistacia atlantica]
MAILCILLSYNAANMYAYFFLLPFLVVNLQGSCVLRLLLPLRLPLSLRSCALDVVSVLRNVHLKQSRSSTCRRIWIEIQLIVMAPTLLNYTGYQFQGPGKCLVWLEPMVLGNQLPSRFWLEN